MRPEQISQLLRTLEGEAVTPFLAKPKRPIPLDKLLADPPTDEDDTGQGSLLDGYVADQLFCADWGLSQFLVNAVRVTGSRQPLTVYIAQSAAPDQDTTTILAWREGAAAGAAEKPFVQLLIGSNGKLFGTEVMGSAPSSIRSNLDEGELEMVLLFGLSWAAADFGQEVWVEFYSDEPLVTDERDESQPFSDWLKGSVRRIS